MPKDDYLKAKRNDIARRATSKSGYRQREQSRRQAKRKRQQTKSVAALNYEMTPTELANDRAMTEHVRARMGKDLDKGTVTDGVRCRVYVNGNPVP